MSLLLFLNLSNSYSSMNMIRINHVVCRLYLNGKSSMVFNRNCFPKMKLKVRPLAGSHVHRKIGISVKKWCKTDTLLLHTTNRKYYGLSIRAISNDLV